MQKPLRASGLNSTKSRQTVLIVGSGGREHALGWKFSQSSRVVKTYFAPGNGGTSENLPIAQNDLQGLAAFAAKCGEDCLTVVGPEEPLSLGIVDFFRSRRLRVLGPTSAAARLETSKAFSKEFMISAGIPTARAQVFSDKNKAHDYVNSLDIPVVVKADGIAAGKGVIVCDDAKQAHDAIDRMMVLREFGSAGDKVIIEERIVGEEASFIALCDGSSLFPLASCQDHKRAFDGDKGPNTGGMGAYSPARILTAELQAVLTKEVMEPALRQMKSRGTPFVGFLYAGIMIDEKSGKPYVLEFNARMGDPECQAIMMRLKSDLFDYADAAAEGCLDDMPPLEWRQGTSVCVVMASRGYPGTYEKGKVIRGLDSDFGPDVQVFHAGTLRGPGGELVTNGGRVLGVTATADHAREAIERAYSAVRKISWGDNDHYYRTDIGHRAIL